MGKVKLVDKKVTMELDKIVKFQLMTYCYINNLTVSESDFECLTLLGLLGEADLTQFCDTAANKGIFKTTQTVRNCIAKMEKQGLVVKNGKSKKKISLNPVAKVQTDGNILLDYKILHIDTKETRSAD
jgi:hypothetical protein